MFLQISIKKSIRRGEGGVLIPKSQAKKTRNPEVPNLNKFKYPEIQKRIPESQKGQSRNCVLENTLFQTPDKGPIPPQSGMVG